MKIDDELQELKRKHPDHCKTLTVTDSNGVMRELIFPRALDLDRPKRPRTNFTSEQLQILEDEFERNQYLVGKDRNDLSHRLQLSETQVKIWFQNRRTKFKKDQQKPGNEGDNDDAPPVDEDDISEIRTKVNNSSRQQSSGKASPVESRVSTKPTPQPPVKRAKKAPKPAPIFFDDDDLSCGSDDSFFAGLSSPSPQLPPIQPPLLSGLNLPPTIPALSGRNPVNEQHFLNPEALLTALQQKQHSGEQSQPQVSASSSYSPPANSVGSASTSTCEVASLVLHQKPCSRNSKGNQIPNYHHPYIRSPTPNPIFNDAIAKAAGFSLNSIFQQHQAKLQHNNFMQQQLAGFLLQNSNANSNGILPGNLQLPNMGNPQAAGGNKGAGRLPQSYWNLVLP